MSDWLHDKHVDPAPIAEDARCRPHFSYVVLDHFFRPEVFERVVEGDVDKLVEDRAFVEWQHAALDFRFDPACRIRAEVRSATPAVPAEGRIALVVYLSGDGVLEIFDNKDRVVDRVVAFENRAVLFATRYARCSFTPDGKEPRVFATQIV